jgi:hypothetical protein
VTDRRHGQDLTTPVRLRARYRVAHLYVWPALVMVAAGCGSDKPVIYAPQTVGNDAGDVAATADAGPSQPSVCTINVGYLAARKSCASDADCALVTFQPKCCMTGVIAAVASDAAEDVRTCAAMGPICAKCTAQPARAEDGRVSTAADGGDVVAQCVAGQCQSAIGARDCGSHQHCKPSEVCVSYEGPNDIVAPDLDGGDNALLSYACMPNPCAGALDCSCAKKLCGSGDDALSCEIERNVDTDVACVPFGN